jgi:two-component SAPR family response regulator
LPPVATTGLHKGSILRCPLFGRELSCSASEVEETGEDRDPPAVRSSSRSLYQAVRDARRLLGAALVTEHDRYRLDRSRVRIDADELEETLNVAAGSGDRQKPLEQALALFRGEPLAGSDYRWADPDVRRLRAGYVELLEQIGRARLACGDPRGALELAERGLAVDELNETFWRLALEAESALGLRAAVSARYQQLARLVDERLGLTPARETRVLYRRLLGQS